MQHRVDRLVDIVAWRTSFAEYGPFKIIFDEQICIALRHDSGISADVPADDLLSLG